jgi:hypothetical protein
VRCCRSDYNDAGSQSVWESLIKRGDCAPGGTSVTAFANTTRTQNFAYDSLNRIARQAEGDRRTYYIFQGESGYLVATPQSPRNYSVTLVQNKVPDVISRKFKGKQVTVKMLKPKGTRAGLFRDYFDRLNALYVMVALGRARKLKKKLGKAMLFRVK